jgi:hypothetical protein
MAHTDMAHADMAHTDMAHTQDFRSFLNKNVHVLIWGGGAGYVRSK